MRQTLFFALPAFALGFVLGLGASGLGALGVKETAVVGEQSNPAVASDTLVSSLRKQGSRPELDLDSGSEAGMTREKATVARVIDGDTVVLENGDRVRYIGMNTPETVDPRRPVQCFGKEASAKNKELVEGKQVELVKDVTDRDRYGRLLRYVWVGDVFVNLELVRQGYALVATYPPDVKYADEFKKAEAEARTAKRGLWGACSGAEKLG